MKRYLVFAGQAYYPSGGWDDFKGSFDSLVEAIALFPIDTESDQSNHDWRDVVDTGTGERVNKVGYGYSRDT